MAENPTNKKTQLEKDVSEVAKGLRSVTNKIAESLPKQEAGFFKLGETIKEVNKVSEELGKDFSKEGKLFNSTLEDIVNTSKSAGTKDLAIQRKRLNEILGTIKDSVSDEEERKVILANFEAVKKQIQGNITFQKELFNQVGKGVSKQITDGIAVIGSIASENPLVGFVFQSIVGLTGTIFTAIKEKRTRDKEIGRADLLKIKEQREQTLDEKRKLLADEQEKGKESPEKEPPIKPKKDDKVVRDNEDRNDILDDIKIETEKTNALLNNITGIFTTNTKKEQQRLATQRAKKSESVLEKPSVGGVQKVKKVVAGKDDTDGFSFFGINISSILKSVTGIFTTPIILGVLATAIAGGLAFVFKEQIANFTKGVSKFADEEIDRIGRDFDKGMEKFNEAGTSFLEGDLIDGIKATLEGAFQSFIVTPLNAFVRSVSKLLVSVIDPFVSDSNESLKLLKKFSTEFDLKKDTSLDNANKKLLKLADKEFVEKQKSKQDAKRQDQKIIKQKVKEEIFEMIPEKKAKANTKVSNDELLKLLLGTAENLQPKIEGSVGNLAESALNVIQNSVQTTNNTNVSQNVASPTNNKNLQTDLLNPAR